MGPFKLLELNFRQIALPPLLGVSVFAVPASACGSRTGRTTPPASGSRPDVAGGASQTPRREWPLLVAASVIGTIAASLYFDGRALVRRRQSIGQQRARILPVRLGRAPQMRVLFRPDRAAPSCLAGRLVNRRDLLKLVGTFTVTHVLRTHVLLCVPQILAWAPPQSWACSSWPLTPPCDHLSGRGPDGEIGSWGADPVSGPRGRAGADLWARRLPRPLHRHAGHDGAGWRHGLLGAAWAPWSRSSCRSDCRRSTSAW